MEKIEKIYETLSANEKLELYNRLRYDFVQADVVDYLSDFDDTLKDSVDMELVEVVTKKFVYEGEYDCNLSYWTNINNLVIECRE